MPEETPTSTPESPPTPNAPEPTNLGEELRVEAKEVGVTASDFPGVNHTHPEIEAFVTELKATVERLRKWAESRGFTQ